MNDMESVMQKYRSKILAHASCSNTHKWLNVDENGKITNNEGGVVCTLEELLSDDKITEIFCWEIGINLMRLSEEEIRKRRRREILERPHGRVEVTPTGDVYYDEDGFGWGSIRWTPEKKPEKKEE